MGGGGKVEYRGRLADQWKVSLPFRHLVRDVRRILGCSGPLLVGVEITLIFMTPAEVSMGASVVVLWMCAMDVGGVEHVLLCLIHENLLGGRKGLVEIMRRGIL